MLAKFVQVDMYVALGMVGIVCAGGWQRCFGEGKVVEEAGGVGQGLGRGSMARKGQGAMRGRRREAKGREKRGAHQNVVWDAQRGQGGDVREGKDGQTFH